jgi:RNA polymerase sigma-70 factor (ECF subfamily)
VRLVETLDPELEAERRLCEAAQGGDRQALGQLLRTHGPRLYRAVLVPRLGSRTLAEEALAITYAKIVESFDRFTWQNVGVYPWLRVVALRVALDLLRARKREVLFEPADLERELDRAEHGLDNAPSLEQRDLALARRRVDDALARLNPRYAQVIRLRILEERSREDAAAVLGVSVSTLDVVLHRALTALKKALKDSPDPSSTRALAAERGAEP